MSDTAEARESIWTTDFDAPVFAPLRENLRADVCVVGAGIAGLTTAYLLARAGQRVVVLDDGPIGSGQTRRTSAHLSYALDDRYHELERLRGPEIARLAAESHLAAIDQVEFIARDEDIPCDFARVDGYLFAGGEPEVATLQRELEAARRIGLNGVDYVPSSPVPFLSPALRFPRCAQFHPLRYLAGLARRVQNMEGRLFSHSHVQSVAGGKDANVTTDAGACVSARAIVVATNIPINNRVAIHLKQSPYLTYMIGLRVPRDAVPQGLYWDTYDPYHYIRVVRTQHDDFVLVGGEDHKTGQADDMAQRFERLQQWALQRFPAAQSVEYRWSGQVMETVDGLAFIGRNPLDADNVFIATGDSGMGLTHGTIAGMLLTDLILDRANPWIDVYDPARKPVRAFLSSQLAEDMNAARQYADWLTPGDVAQVEDIPLDSGALMRQGARKLAVYRDSAGELTTLSAVCPHLGCIVHWNKSEKTWDCPCHGSRFNCHGQVISGPANTSLEAVETPAKVEA